MPLSRDVINTAASYRGYKLIIGNDLAIIPSTPVSREEISN